MQAEIANAINDPSSPTPYPSPNSSQAAAPIYVVIVDPNHSDTNGGYNIQGTYTYSDGQVANINMISIGTSFFSGTTTVVPDSFTMTFGHEMAERMSDPTGDNNGVSVTPPAALPNNLIFPPGVTTGQIGDYEPVQPGGIHYAYRLGGTGGVAVQPYWSATDQAFVVADGNSQTVYLSPNWTITNPGPPQNETGTFSGNYGLMIVGDNVTYNATAAGTQVTVNGQTFYFDPGTITSALIYIADTNNTVNIDGVAGGQSLTVYLENGSDTANVCAANRDLNAIQGGLGIHGFGALSDTLNVYDQAEGGANYSLSSTDLVRLGGGLSGLDWSGIDYVNINGGAAGPNTYLIEGTDTETNLNTNSAGDSISVNQTDLGTALNITTASNTRVDMGACAPCRTSGAVNVTLNNAALIDTDTVNIDDSSDAGGHTVYVDNGSIDYLAPAFIYIADYTCSNINVAGSQGGTTWNVLGTEPPAVGIVNGHPVFFYTTTTITANGTDTVNVGFQSEVQYIQGPLDVNSSHPDAVTMTIDDSADPSAYTATVTTNSIQGVGTAAPIGYGNGSLSSLNILGGTGGDTWNVQSTEGPLYMLVSGGTVNVGNAGSVQGILGLLDINGPVNNGVVLNINDSADPASYTANLSVDTDLNKGSVQGMRRRNHVQPRRAWTIESPGRYRGRNLGRAKHGRRPAPCSQTRPPSPATAPTPSTSARPAASPGSSAHSTCSTLGPRTPSSWMIRPRTTAAHTP